MITGGKIEKQCNEKVSDLVYRWDISVWEYECYGKRTVCQYGFIA